MQCPSPRLHLFTIQHSSTHYFIIFGTVPKILNLKSTLCRRKQVAAHLFNTLHWCNLSFPNNLHFFGDYLISRLFSTAAFPSYGLWSPDIKPYSPSTFHFSLLWFEYEMSPIGPVSTWFLADGMALEGDEPSEDSFTRRTGRLEASLEILRSDPLTVYSLPSYCGLMKPVASWSWCSAFITIKDWILLKL